MSYDWNQEWYQDSELEASFELRDQIMDCNLEGASCFLRGETDAQCAARWREKAYAVSKYAKDLIEDTNKLSEKIRFMNLQSREYENKKGESKEEVSKEKRAVIDICESQLGASDISGNYSFRNESYIYTINIFDCAWAGEVTKKGNRFGEWLSGGRYVDVFAKDQVLHFISHYKNKHHAKETRSVLKGGLSVRAAVEAAIKGQSSE